MKEKGSNFIFLTGSKKGDERMRIANTKEQFVKEWKEHFNRIHLLAANFDGEEFEEVFCKLSEVKETMKDIINRASEKFTP